MIPTGTYGYLASSSSSSPPHVAHHHHHLIDLNNDQVDHQNHHIDQPASNYSFCSSDDLSYDPPPPSFLFNTVPPPLQHQPNHLPPTLHHHEKGEKKISIIATDEEEDADADAVKVWKAPKIRIMRKMQQQLDHSIHQQHQLVTDNSSSNSNSNSVVVNVPVRVCSDCHTTKTPLWRSGPAGPKSLCNACGIRQRKARRAAAMAAAAASANGTILVPASTETSVKGNKKLGSKKKENKSSKIECAPNSQLKKKRKQLYCQGRRRNKLLGFEDLMRLLSLSNNSINNIQVFPQDEKEAAILLMALSYGLVHG